MQTIQINNPEIENFISSQYGNNTQDLLSDFVKFVKLSLDDGYPTISKDEARKRVTQAVEEVRNGEAVLLTQEEYDKEMNEFMKSL
ncbi:hypothetical protein [Sulfurimonas sp.]|jgi:hypothetical protein|uniref:hypothetical protein n=1 Tax=Sulfurimonas sp. TaxID=2022749 RepID=UPI0025E99432|nr:hypothetical protein [Sulfurimonas sp.]MBT5933937.1 hypothetical protein [Sulfurimonas sp.]